MENPATLAEIEAELEKFRGDSLVFSSWGGAYQAAQRKAYFIPFQEQFGIEIIEDSQPTNALLRAQALSGNITWDAFGTGQDAIYVLGKTGDLEVVDHAIIDNRDAFEIDKTPWGGPGGDITWSTVIAYNTDSYAGNPPTRAADFYDLEKFPGRRSWAYYQTHELRFALLAKYPELIETAEGRNSLSRLSDDQVDEAFEFLDQHKDQVSVVWQTGSDCPQLLISGEVDMCTAWNGRIYDAAKEGAPIAVCWKCGHLLNTGSHAIIKGLAEQDPEKFYLAQLYIAWTGFPERNAEISKYIAYGPVNLKSLEVLERPEFDDFRDHLPSSGTNIVYAILHDEEDTGEKYDGRYERYLEILQSIQ